LKGLVIRSVESVEQAVGVVTIKDLFRLAAQGKSALLFEVMRGSPR
jgi:hypothetical protein